MSHTGCWVWDVRSAAPVYWSTEMSRICGRDPARGLPSVDEFRAIHALEDWSDWLAAVRRSVQDRTDFAIECRLVTPKGDVRQVRITGRPIAGAANEVTEIIGSTALVTGLPADGLAQSRTEDAPSLPMIDLIPGMVWSALRDGSNEYCNRTWLDYTGHTAEKARGWGWIESVHPDDLERLRQYWLSVVATCEPGEIEARLRRFDGEYRWFLFRARPHLDGSRTVIKWYGTNTDIHDRKLAEEAVRASETRLRLITETIPAILTSRDDQGKLDYVNRRLEDYIGKSGQEIIDSWVSLIHPDDRESLLRVWRDSQETGERYELDYRMLGANGEYRWFQVRGAPLLDQEARVLRWYSVITDIEEARRAREALLKSQTRLARMSQITAIAELSASIAHEVNQPLAAILANANACLAWLTSDPPNLERVRGTAEKIIRNANSAAEVVRRVRALFKQAPPAMVLSDINDTVLEVLNLIASDFRDADIGVDTELAPDLPMIAMDRIQIQQILMNLARNAIEAMEGVRGRPRKLSLVTRCDGVEILMQVSDSGCGIANPSSIFDPFFTTKETGMGMGLAICRSIVEAHGGRLWATPNEGAGTTFSLTLPLHSDAAR